MTVSDSYFRDALAALKEARMSLMLASYDAHSEAFHAGHDQHVQAVDGAMLAGRLDALASQLECVMAETRRARKKARAREGRLTR
jgi:hypothetical protein